MILAFGSIQAIGSATLVFVSFLDSLENNLKSLESLEADGLDDQKRRETERAKELAEAPWAEKLKSSTYVVGLMQALTRAGFTRRLKVNFAWIGRSLRAEALDQRLELQPTADGIIAAFDGQSIPIDLSKPPGPLVEKWMALLDRKRLEQSGPVVS